MPNFHGVIPFKYTYSLWAMNRRHTLSIGDEAYKKLKSKGNFGESYTKLILRLLDTIDAVKNGVIDFE